MTASVIPFAGQPAGFEWLADEPRFDPQRHLRLEMPVEVSTLDDFGYGPDEIAATATAIAVTSAFRVLSDEGAEVMLDTARRLESFASSNPRIERNVRSGCHRSRWLRDLCLAPEITEHLGSIYGTDIAPHPIASQLGHLNYAPTAVGDPVDKWHHDTLALDYVMMVADPALLDGGDFEYFVGTKHEARLMAEAGDRPPADRCVSVVWPGPGYAVALHGNMVVHRGGPLHQPGERITMVNGYVSTDVSLDPQTRHADLFHADEPTALASQIGRYAAWRARERLDQVIASLPAQVDPAAATDLLLDAVADVEQAIRDLDGSSNDLHHYEH